MLVDEAEAVTEGAPRSYGHVVVDEAQDLTAMAFRVLSPAVPVGLADDPRRPRPGDARVVAQRSWDEAIAHLGQPAERVGGRARRSATACRAPVLDWANRLLPKAAPQVRPARSVRETGAAPVLVPVEREDLATSVEAELAALTGDWVSVAVIAPEALLAELEAVVKAAAERLGEHGHVALLDPLGAKGLEFDAVVVVEPALIYGEVNGARLLYVAMTRAVQHLSLVHSLALPAVLTAV